MQQFTAVLAAADFGNPALLQGIHEQYHFLFQNSFSVAFIP